MPFRFPFMPYGYNNYNYRRPLNQFPHMQNNFSQSDISNNFNATDTTSKSQEDKQKNSESSNTDRLSEDSEYFFEIFGLRLHFDDVLIICILLFLYNEQVQDQELFLCLILLLIS